MRDKLKFISQKTNFAEAIRYTPPCWRGFSSYGGRIAIDYNIVEYPSGFAGSAISGRRL